MSKEYNRSPNAMRDYTVEGGGSQHGKSYANIRCPFCGTLSRAYLWSLAGGGKCCENKRCGAKHNSWGGTIPVVGREDMKP
jgi:hypothetical protein